MSTLFYKLWYSIQIYDINTNNIEKCFKIVNKKEDQYLDNTDLLEMRF